MVAALTVAATGCFDTKSSPPHASSSDDPASAATSLRVTAPAVAVIDGAVFVVSPNQPPRRLIRDVKGSAQVEEASTESILVGVIPIDQIVIGLSTPFVDRVQGGLSLIPDSLNRKWSNYGELDPGGSTRYVLSPLSAPYNTTAVAKLSDGYLLTDVSGALLRWTTAAPVRIAAGPAHVLGVRGDLVAWTDDAGKVVHVTNLANNRTTNVSSPEPPITARFSPNGSAVAWTTLSEAQNVVLANLSSGRILAQVPTAQAGTGLYRFRRQPPALQPVPFGWSADGTQLLVVEKSTNATRIEALDAKSGQRASLVPAPLRLQQLIPL
ncbi:MAG TPA: hypothetical protein VN636_00560 [Acidimicrobiia bacterium]|nr:hypothetical protein [Acidimicrobiia bacterium]